MCGPVAISSSSWAGDPFILPCNKFVLKVPKQRSFLKLPGGLCKVFGVVVFEGFRELAPPDCCPETTGKGSVRDAALNGKQCTPKNDGCDM